MNDENTSHYWILEWRNNTPVKIHHIVNPGRSEKGGYQHMMSTHAFWSNELTRVSKAFYTAPFRYEVIFQREYERDELQGFENRYAEYPHEESGTIFEFYEKVGYDRKKKQFLPTSAT